MRAVFLIFSAFAALFLFGACAGKVFVIPSDGTTAKYQDLVADEDGRFMIKLDPGTTVAYHGFSIRTPSENLFRVYVSENSRESAVWRAAYRLESGHGFACTVSRIMLPPQLVTKLSGDDFLTAYCKAKYANDSRTLHFSCNPIDFQGFPAISFSLQARIPESFENAVSDGILLVDPDEPGVILEMQCWETGYGLTLKKRDKNLKKLGEIFFSLIRLP